MIWKRLKQNKWKVIIIIALIAFFFPKPYNLNKWIGLCYNPSGEKLVRHVGNHTHRIYPKLPAAASFRGAGGYCLGIPVPLRKEWNKTYSGSGVKELRVAGSYDFPNMTFN